MNGYFALLAALETGSFTKAAEQLGYTQSAVSQLIKTIEQELETQLIVRSRSGVTLTPDGEQYLPYIKKICNAIRELENKKNVMQGLDSGVIRIGTIASIASNYLPIWMKDFKQLYPHIRFELFLGDYSEIEEMIESGKVDFGFINPAVITTLTSIPIVQDDMIVLVPKNSELANLDAITLQQLEKEPFILIKEGNRSAALQLFEEQQLTPRVEFTAQDDHAVLEMVRLELGVTIVPSLVLKNYEDGIVMKRLTPAKKRTISLAFKDKMILQVASRTFIDFILTDLNL